MTISSSFPTAVPEPKLHLIDQSQISPCPNPLEEKKTQHLRNLGPGKRVRETNGQGRDFCPGAIRPNTWRGKYSSLKFVEKGLRQSRESRVRGGGRRRSAQVAPDLITGYPHPHPVLREERCGGTVVNKTYHKTCSWEVVMRYSFLASLVVVLLADCSRICAIIFLRMSVRAGYS